MATDDAGAPSHLVRDDWHEEDGTAADDGLEETHSFATDVEVVEYEVDATDDEVQEEGSANAEDGEADTAAADDEEAGSDEEYDEEAGSADKYDEEAETAAADEEGIYEDDVELSSSGDADEGAATANDPMQVDPGEDGVETGGGTFAGSANDVAEDDGKGGDDQDDGEGVDMDGVVVGGDANRAAGQGGVASVPGCWRVGLMTWAHSHGHEGVTATADGPLWAPLYWLRGRSASVGHK